MLSAMQLTIIHPPLTSCDKQGVGIHNINECLSPISKRPLSLFHMKMYPGTQAMGEQVCYFLGVSGVEYRMERWNGKWNGTVNIHGCS